MKRCLKTRKQKSQNVGRSKGGEMRIKRLVKRSKSSFGLSYDIDAPYDVVILCVNNGQGLVPVRLLLPGQVYEQTIRKLLNEYPQTKTITVIPAYAKDYIDIVKIL